jgi:hypothetical protein
MTLFRYEITFEVVSYKRKFREREATNPSVNQGNIYISKTPNMSVKKMVVKI